MKKRHHNFAKSQYRGKGRRKYNKELISSISLKEGQTIDDYLSSIVTFWHGGKNDDVPRHSFVINFKWIKNAISKNDFERLIIERLGDVLIGDIQE